MNTKPVIFLLFCAAYINCQGQNPNYSEDQFPFIQQSQAHKIVFSNEKTVLDTTPVMRLADTGPEYLAFSSDSKKLFVIMRNSGGEYVYALVAFDIKTGKEVERYKFGSYIPDNRFCIATDAASKSVAIIYRQQLLIFNESSLAKPVKTISSERYFVSIAYSPDGSKIGALTSDSTGIGNNNSWFMEVFSVADGKSVFQKKLREFQSNIMMSSQLQFLTNNDYLTYPEGGETAPVMQLSALCNYSVSGGYMRGILVCNTEGKHKGDCFVASEENFSTKPIYYLGYSGRYIATTSGFFSFDDPNAYAGSFMEFYVRQYDQEGLKREENKIKSFYPNKGDSYEKVSSISSPPVTSDNPSYVATVGVGRGDLWKYDNGTLKYHKTIKLPIATNTFVVLSPTHQYVAYIAYGQVEVYETE